MWASGQAHSSACWLLTLPFTRVLGSGLHTHWDCGSVCTAVIVAVVVAEMLQKSAYMGLCVLWDRPSGARSSGPWAPWGTQPESGRWGCCPALAGSSWKDWTWQGLERQLWEREIWFDSILLLLIPSTSFV